MLRPSSFIALLLGLVALLGACSPAERAQQGPVVLAASSLQEVLEEAADQWAMQGHPRPVLSFAGTPALAKQVEAGAPADLVISADEQWMDWLEERALIRTASRRPVAANGLALVGLDSRIAGDSIPQKLRNLGDGHLAMGDPASVPAGRYGKAALKEMGLWELVADRIVPTENVRAALALVERGEAELAIVYTSDLHASDAPLSFGVFDIRAGGLISYPAAQLASSNHPEASAFLEFLSSEQGQDVFARHGFVNVRRLQIAE